MKLRFRGEAFRVKSRQRSSAPADVGYVYRGSPVGDWGLSPTQRTAPVPGASSTPPAARGLAALLPPGRDAPTRFACRCPRDAGGPTHNGLRPSRAPPALRPRLAGFPLSLPSGRDHPALFELDPNTRNKTGGAGFRLSVVGCRFGRSHTRGVNLNTRNARVGKQETRNQKPETNPQPSSYFFDPDPDFDFDPDPDPDPDPDFDFDPLNPQPSTRNLQPATFNPQPSTFNPQPATRNQPLPNRHTDLIPN